MLKSHQERINQADNWDTKIDEKGTSRLLDLTSRLRASEEALQKLGQESEIIRKQNLEYCHTIDDLKVQIESTGRSSNWSTSRAREYEEKLQSTELRRRDLEELLSESESCLKDTMLSLKELETKFAASDERRKRAEDRFSTAENQLAAQERNSQMVIKKLEENQDELVAKLKNCESKLADTEKRLAAALAQVEDTRSNLAETESRHSRSEIQTSTLKQRLLAQAAAESGLRTNGLISHGSSKNSRDDELVNLAMRLQDREKELHEAEDALNVLMDQLQAYETQSSEDKIKIRELSNQLASARSSAPAREDEEFMVGATSRTHGHQSEAMLDVHLKLREKENQLRISDEAVTVMKERLRNCESDLERANDTITALTNELEATTRQLSIGQNGLSDIVPRLEEYQAKLKQSEALVSQLESRLRSQDAQNGQDQKTINELKGQLQATKMMLEHSKANQVADYDHDYVSDQTQRAKAQSSAADLLIRKSSDKQLDDVSVNNDAKSRLQEAETTVQQLRANHEREQARIYDLIRQVEASKLTIENLNLNHSQELSDIRNKRDQLEAQLTELDSWCQRFAERENSFKNDRSDLIKKLRQSEDKYSSLEASLSLSQESTKAVEADNQELAKQCHWLQSQLDEVVGRLQSMDSENAKETRSVTEMSMQIEELHGVLKDTMGCLMDREQELGRLSAELSSARDEYNRLQERAESEKDERDAEVEGLRSQFDDLIFAIERDHRLLAEKDALIAIHTSRINDLEKSAHDANSAVESYARQVTDLGGNIRDLEGKLKLADDRFQDSLKAMRLGERHQAQCNDQIKEYEGKMARMESEISSLQKQVDDYNDDFSVKAEIIQQLQARLADSQMSLKESEKCWTENELLKSKEKQLDAALSTIQTQEQLLSDLEKILHDAEERYETAVQSTRKYEKMIEDKDLDIEGYRINCQKLEEANKTLSLQEKATEDQCIDLQRQLSSEQAEYNDLQLQLKELQQRYQRLETESQRSSDALESLLCDTVEKNSVFVKDLQSKLENEVNESRARIKELDTRLETANSRNGLLEGALWKTENQLKEYERKLMESKARCECAEEARLCLENQLAGLADKGARLSSPATAPKSQYCSVENAVGLGDSSDKDKASFATMALRLKENDELLVDCRSKLLTAQRSLADKEAALTSLSTRCDDLKSCLTSFWEGVNGVLADAPAPVVGNFENVLKHAEGLFSRLDVTIDTRRMYGDRSASSTSTERRPTLQTDRNWDKEREKETNSKLRLCMQECERQTKTIFDLRIQIKSLQTQVEEKDLVVTSLRRDIDHARTTLYAKEQELSQLNTRLQKSSSSSLSSESTVVEDLRHQLRSSELKLAEKVQEVEIQDGELQSLRSKLETWRRVQSLTGGESADKTAELQQKLSESAAELQVLRDRLVVWERGASRSSTAGGGVGPEGSKAVGGSSSTVVTPTSSFLGRYGSSYDSLSRGSTTLTTSGVLGGGGYTDTQPGATPSPTAAAAYKYTSTPFSTGEGRATGSGVSVTPPLSEHKFTPSRLFSDRLKTPNVAVTSSPLMTGGGSLNGVGQRHLMSSLSSEASLAASSSSYGSGDRGVKASDDGPSDSSGILSCKMK